MTREDERLMVAEKTFPMDKEVMSIEEQADMILRQMCFNIGAKWADENPSEENLTAYLSKRGWPVSEDGKVLSYGKAIKLCEKSLSYDKKKWVENACKFLESTDFCHYYNKEFIEEFKRQMEDKL